MPPEWECLRAASPRLELQDDLICFYLRCRSANLAQVQSNFRLLMVPINAASASNAAFGKQSAAVLPSLAPHDSKARLIVVTTRRDSWRSHVHRTNTAQRVQSFKRPTANVGGRGGLPSSFSGGFKGGILFEKRIPPLSRVPTAGGDPHTAPAALQNSRTSVRCEKRSTLWNIQ